VGKRAQVLGANLRKLADAVEAFDTDRRAPTSTRSSCASWLREHSERDDPRPWAPASSSAEAPGALYVVNVEVDRLVLRTRVRRQRTRLRQVKPTLTQYPKEHHEVAVEVVQNLVRGGGLGSHLDCREP
jgi:hypothetical protein